MALSNAERQRRWRETHPEKAKARLEAFKVQKAQDKTTTKCDHDDRGVRIPAYYCGKCRRGFIAMSDHLKIAHEKWLSRPQPRYDGE